MEDQLSDVEGRAEGGEATIEMDHLPDAAAVGERSSIKAGTRRSGREMSDGALEPEAMVYPDLPTRAHDPARPEAIETCIASTNATRPRIIGRRDTLSRRGGLIHRRDIVRGRRRHRLGEETRRRWNGEEVDIATSRGIEGILMVTEADTMIADLHRGRESGRTAEAMIEV